MRTRKHRQLAVVPPVVKRMNAVRKCVSRAMALPSVCFVAGVWNIIPYAMEKTVKGRPRGMHSLQFTWRNGPLHRACKRRVDVPPPWLRRWASEKENAMVRWNLPRKACVRGCKKGVFEWKVGEGLGKQHSGRPFPILPDPFAIVNFDRRPDGAKSRRLTLAEAARLYEEKEQVEYSKEIPLRDQIPRVEFQRGQTLLNFAHYGEPITRKGKFAKYFPACSYWGEVNKSKEYASARSPAHIVRENVRRLEHKIKQMASLSEPSQLAAQLNEQVYIGHLILSHNLPFEKKEKLSEEVEVILEKGRQLFVDSVTKVDGEIFFCEFFSNVFSSI